MYTSLKAAHVLFSLGFPHKLIQPGDAYGVKDQEWITGGEIFPITTPIIPPSVTKRGTWLPSTLDLLIWLMYYTDQLWVKHDTNESECVTIQAIKTKHTFKLQDTCSLEFSLSRIAIQLLIKLKKEHARSFTHTPPRALYPISQELAARERRYLTEQEMINLTKIGFSIDHGHLQSEGDCHAYEGKSFVLGGPLFFRKTPALLCPMEIRTSGMRLASFDELETWLLNRVAFVMIKEKGKPHRATLYLEKGEFSVESDSFLNLFQNLIIKTLEIAPELAPCDQPEPVRLQM